MMVSTTVQTMKSKLKHDDAQVVLAMKRRRSQLTQLYKEQVDVSPEAEEAWIWHHLFTVMDHAIKIFETPLEDLVENLQQETK